MRKVIKKLGRFIYAFPIVTTLFSLFIFTSMFINNETFETINVSLKQVRWFEILIIVLSGFLASIPLTILFYLLKDRLVDSKKPQNNFIAEVYSIATIQNTFGSGGLFSNFLLFWFFRSNNKNNDKLHGLGNRLFWWQALGSSIFLLISALLFLLFVNDDNYFSYLPWVFLILIFYPFIGLLYYKEFSNQKQANDEISLIQDEVVEETLATQSVINTDDNFIPLTTQQKVTTLILSIINDLFQVLVFLSIGFFLGGSIDFLLEASTLYIMAKGIGRALFIPGGIGVFDYVVYSGLLGMDIDPSTAFIWLVLYRLLFTFIPLISTVLISTLSRGTQSFNTQFKGVPQQISTFLLHKVVTFLLYFESFILIVSGAFPELIERYDFTHSLHPISLGTIFQIPNIILGALFLLAGRAIANKTKRSFWPIVTLIIVTFGFIFFARTKMAGLILLIVILLFLFVIRKVLVREQLLFSLESRIKDLSIWISIFLVYFIVGIITLPNPKRTPTTDYFFTPNLIWWLSGLVTFTIMTLFLVVFGRWLIRKKKSIGEPVDQRVDDVLALGDNHYAPLVYLGDKEVFYYYDKQGKPIAGLQYRALESKLAVMSDPFGNPTYYPDVIREFIIQADTYNFTPIFYEISEKTASLVHEYGYNFMKLGEEAHVVLSDFSLGGKKKQNIRTALNQAEKNGFTFEILKPPYQKRQLNALKKISDEWLDGREEKGYSLGFFKPDYLQHFEIAILRDEKNKIVAFANLISSKTEKQLTVDLMRFTKKAPNGVMNLLFAKTIEYAKENEYEIFNLGMSPLTNVGANEQAFIQERIANIVYQLGNEIYSFEGLHKFKNQFLPKWVNYFIGYSRNSSIIIVLLALLRIDNTGEKK